MTLVTLVGVMLKVCTRRMDYVNSVCPAEYKSARANMRTIIKDHLEAYVKADRHGRPLYRMRLLD